MTARVDRALTAMSGPAAPPRRNGELVFEAPWQGRAFGLALGAVEQLGVNWSVFQERLIAAIAARPDAPYYDCWVAALERLLLDYGLATPEEIDTAQHSVKSERSSG